MTIEVWTLLERTTKYSRTVKLFVHKTKVTSNLCLQKCINRNICLLYMWCGRNRCLDCKPLRHMWNKNNNVDPVSYSVQYRCK